MAVSPPRPKGPPLNALRAFEAAARLGGFAAAAEELCVTPGAVAQHVKTLEAWAGAALFERRSRGVRLTLLGEGALDALGLAFDRLGEAVQALRMKAKPGQIRIAALPSVAQLWLSPRLPAIRALIPDMTISVTAVERRPNMLREPFDLCIFYEDGPPAADAVEIGRDVIFPVCAPSFLASLQRTADLENATFLHDSAWSGDWALWLEAVAPAERFDTRGPIFSLYSLAVEEAKNGAGVLIGHEALVSAYLEAGTLVAPFETSLALDRRLTITLSPTSSEGSAPRRIAETLAGDPPNDVGSAR